MQAPKVTLKSSTLVFRETFRSHLLVSPARKTQRAFLLPTLPLLSPSLGKSPRKPVQGSQFSFYCFLLLTPPLPSAASGLFSASCFPFDLGSSLTCTPHLVSKWSSEFCSSLILSTVRASLPGLQVPTFRPVWLWSSNFGHNCAWSACLF